MVSRPSVLVHAPEASDEPDGSQPLHLRQGGHRASLCCGDSPEVRGSVVVISHLFKKTVGVGIFLLPMLRKETGLWASIVLDVLVAATMIDAGLMLLRTKELLKPRRTSAELAGLEIEEMSTMEETTDAADDGADVLARENGNRREAEDGATMRPTTSHEGTNDNTVIERSWEQMTYSTMCNVVAGPWTARLVRVSLLVSQFLGDCTLYVQTAATVLGPLLASWWMGDDSSSSSASGSPTTSPWFTSYSALIVIECVVVFPLTLLTNRLGWLVIASAIASGFLFFCLAVTGELFIRQLSSEGISKEISDFGSVSGWVLYIPSAASALANAIILLPLSSGVKEKSVAGRLGSLYVGTTAGTALLYCSYGLLGYMAFGNRFHGSAVSMLPKGSTLAQGAQALLAIQLLLSWGIQFLPAIQVVDEWVEGSTLNAPVAGTATVTAAGQRLHPVIEDENDKDDAPPRRLSASLQPPDHHRRSFLFVATRVVVVTVIALVALLVGSETIDLVMAFIGSTVVLTINVIVPSILFLVASSSSAAPETMKQHRRLLSSSSSSMRRSSSSWWSHMTSLKHPLTSIRVRCMAYIVIGIPLCVIGTIDSIRGFYRR